MKERPILFSGEMVRAILDGRKSQTRRVVKKQPHGAGNWVLRGVHWFFPNVNPYLKMKCPYGQPGDRLWVRETFNGNKEIGIAYRATNPELNGCPWKPSIFMPRWASRINLEITNIRIESLNDISEEDALAEGIEALSGTIDRNVFFKNYAKNSMHWFDSKKLSYISLWESINGTGSWDKNPWVWVVEFRRLS